MALLTSPRKALLNPITRMAVLTFTWNHRHEILRWGRSLYDQVVGRTDVSPARALRTSATSCSIASDRRLRDAVSSSGGSRWSATPSISTSTRRGPSCPG